MKIKRLENAARNVKYGVLMQMINTLLPFLVRSVMIRTLSIEYLGLSSFCQSILLVLNLAELGVGNAMVFSMYKPIVEDDRRTICALMNMYRRYYRIIGAVIGLLGLCLVPFLRSMVHDTVPAGVSLELVFVMNLSVVVLSYWLFAYQRSLIYAHQRVDIYNKITTVTSIVQNLLQIATLFFLHDYYAYMIVFMVVQVINNLTNAYVSRRLYPSYRPKGKLSQEEVCDINRRIRDLFTTKIGNVIVNNADTLVISSFLGLSVLAVFQNYYFILSAIVSMVAILFTASVAGVGNSLITESKEKNYQDLQKMTFITSWASGFCACSLLCLYQPFMEVWMGAENVLPIGVVIMFCMYYFIIEVDQLLNMFKDAAGIWHRDRFRPLITALANLVMNLIMVQFIGLYGILLSTVLSLLGVGMPWLLHNLFTELFDRRDLRRFVQSLLGYAATCVLAAALTYGLCSLIPAGGVLALVLRVPVCILVPNAVFLLAWRRLSAFDACVAMVKGMLRRG